MSSRSSGDDTADATRTSTASSPNPAHAGASGGTGYRERLWPSPAACLACLPIVLGAVLVPLPIFGPGAGVVGGLLGVLAVVALLASMAWRIEVAGGVLRVGRARLPVAVVGEVDVLDRAALRRAVGPGLDARAHLALRPWAPEGVRIHLEDASDPTPYWVVSTRRPEELAAALRAR
ncbi:DUF3093 domain-containing protein [Kineococcus gynurae]|uniref:DUF3093 domain-containing protein n=1 Tax=Kineococcus gynurae TaxID=452979 RepID=A0ABV5LV24_9ACTN